MVWPRGVIDGEGPPGRAKGKHFFAEQLTDADAMHVCFAICFFKNPHRRHPRRRGDDDEGRMFSSSYTCGDIAEMAI